MPVILSKKTSQVRNLKMCIKVLFFLLCFVTITSGRPRRHRNRNRKLLRHSMGLAMQLRMMKSTIDDAITEYITSEMNCTSIHECRIQTTGLTLSYLPAMLRAEDAENWNEAFSENLKRLHVYNFYLKEFIKTSEDTSLSRIASLHLNDVNNLLHQFLIAFKANMEMMNCYNLRSNSSSRPPCVICVHPNLPSRALEIVRNYQFLIQLHDFLHDFYSLYSNFLNLDRRSVSNC